MGNTADDRLNERAMNEAPTEWGGISHLMQHSGISEQRGKDGKKEKRKKRKDEVIVEIHKHSLHWYPPSLLIILTRTGRSIEQAGICCPLGTDMAWSNTTCHRGDALNTGLTNQVLI